MANVTASKMIADENQKQAEADEIEAQQRMQEAIDKRVPDYFKK